MDYVIKTIEEKSASVTFEVYLPELDETFFLNMNSLEFYRSTEDQISRQVERAVEERERVNKLRTNPDSRIQGMINDKESLKDRLNERIKSKRKEE